MTQPNEIKDKIHSLLRKQGMDISDMSDADIEFAIQQYRDTERLGVLGRFKWLPYRLSLQIQLQCLKLRNYILGYD